MNLGNRCYCLQEGPILGDHFMQTLSWLLYDNLQRTMVMSKGHKTPRLETRNANVIKALAKTPKRTSAAANTNAALRQCRYRDRVQEKRPFVLSGVSVLPLAIDHVEPGTSQTNMYA
eukprot:gb/GECG01000093.1/.p1 GENE.gb/GECG01000093.1/~~gb/GECG01000093.1/.p1  ORF type:complete len:117 (+),score=5.96 gb/GECG01000093.1/:1-351(+)